MTNIAPRRITSQIASLPGMRATWNKETYEYRVAYAAAAMPQNEKREATAYYTDDAQDAIDTARRMSAELHG